MTYVFELYNTVAVLLLPEYRTAAFVGHHVVTCLLAYLSLTPFLHYYGFFFFGLAAVSSVPLAIVEVTKSTGMTSLSEVLKMLFAVLFLAIRTAYWPVVSYGFWQDTLGALSDGSVHSVPAAVIFLVANVGLTGLQFYWTTLIISGIVEMSQGKVAKHS